MFQSASWAGGGETSVSIIKILPVIMSGGSGTRLWPLSTDERPKQFHDLGGDASMIVDTARRLSGVHGEIAFLPPVVIANAAHAELVQSQLAAAGIDLSAIALEPMGRNTAATAALAALLAREIDPEALVLLAPADHRVENPAALIAAIGAAAALVADHIVTFGITPTAPETGYGYIQQGDALGPGLHHVLSFKEKPDQATAEGYLQAGGYTWNSGMFFFSPTLMLEEFGIASADIRDGAIAALERAERDRLFIRLDAATFASIRSEAVDRAVMEKTQRGAVAPCDIGWADIGSWAEVWRLSEQDGEGNRAEGPVTLLDCQRSLVRSDGLQVSVIGADDLVVVAHGNSVLIMPRSRAQDVKKVIPLRK